MSGAEQDLEQRLAEESALRVQAEQASHQKDEFLSTLGHELRAPLNAILGWSRLLESGRLAPEEVRRAGQTIVRNVRALAQLVDDLLDLSGMVSGKIRLDAEETDLGEIIEAALETMQGTAEAKGIVLQKVLPAEACMVFGDPHRLQQVIWNLLNNAVKFTPRAGTVIARLEHAHCNWEVSIEDTGIGLAPQRLPLVFEPFTQTDAVNRRDYPGLGMGLAIAKQIVELHGGRVWAASAGEGLGATFHVSLPRVAPRAEASGAASDAFLEDDGIDLNGVRVLVVDDEPDTLELSRRVLGGYHATVVTVANVDAALATLSGFHADVLISDLGMPGRDGYELIRTVRLNQGPDVLPAAALTAFARPEDAVRAQDAGFQMHLAKPVEPDELVRIVAHLAGRH
ncbi:MAG TPA: ATP-binding protein [Steroidobacteraceae bacterium]|nr:ATP-binding protein [Steroidobacteraceae bacterium]